MHIGSPYVLDLSPDEAEIVMRALSLYFLHSDDRVRPELRERFERLRDHAGRMFGELENHIRKQKTTATDHT